VRICRITGSVHATVKDPPLEGAKILIAQPVDLEGRETGAPFLCLDRDGAGEGDLVLMTKEGGGARMILSDPRSPVQCLAVAVIDDIHLAE